MYMIHAVCVCIHNPDLLCVPRLSVCLFVCGIYAGVYMRLSVCLFVCGPLAPSQSATSVGHNGSVPWCRGAVVPWFRGADIHRQNKVQTYIDTYIRQTNKQTDKRTYLYLSSSLCTKEDGDLWFNKACRSTAVSVARPITTNYHCTALWGSASATNTRSDLGCFL